MFTPEEILGIVPSPPQKGPDERSPGRVAIDQAHNVLMGPYNAVTSLPAFVASGAEAIGQAVTGGGTSKGQEIIRNLVPRMTTVRGAAALVAPNSVTAPSDEEWAQAAQGAGTNLMATLIPGAAKVATGAKESVPRAMMWS